MKKLLLVSLLLVLFVPSIVLAQCFRLSGCAGWVHGDPVFANQVNDNVVSLVVIASDETESITIYWGDRSHDTYIIPLPVVMEHKYRYAGFDHSLRVTVVDKFGEETNYTRNDSDALRIYIPD